MSTNQNELAQSSSLYLQQHAGNPVHWKNWGDAALEKSQKEQKLLIISIGYSSCHWCHVMEEESFEDHTVADAMNADFVSIKVDREERPDIDARYMNAIQLMTGQGGWPLNVIALPDGTPIYGGTYFSKADWLEALSSVQSLWQEDPEKVRDYGAQMREGLTDMVKVSQSVAPNAFQKTDFEDVVAFWMRTIDPVNGGPNGSPKFPLPNNYSFLLDYSLSAADTSVLDYTLLTLDKIALGGIYDQVHGGFTRYATDRFWKVPHFEKMLYDNAQLIGLYAKAYRATKRELYAQTLHGTIAFLEQQMKLSNGLYASALDADSPTPREQREEGGFYVWTPEELEALHLPEKSLFDAYFDIKEHHDWEGKFILHRNTTDDVFAEQHALTLAALQEYKTTWLRELKSASAARLTTHPRPIRDEKAITSWNALLVEGFVEAHWAFPNSGYDSSAITLMEALEKQVGSAPQLLHQAGSSQEAFLDDHASYGNALLAVYQLTGQSQYLEKAIALHRVFDRFKTSGLFYALSAESEENWQTVIEIEDNVIPSANSMLAHFKYKLGVLAEDNEALQEAKDLCEGVHKKVFKYGPNFSNWLQLAMQIESGGREAVFTGPQAFELRNDFTSLKYVPGTLFLAGKTPSDAPLLLGRFPKDGNLIFICKNHSCQLPTDELKTALDLWTL